jgi:undecaprenyl-diphosphatase
LPPRIGSLVPLLVLAGLLAIAIAVTTDLAAGRGVLSVDVRFGRWLQSERIPLGSAIAWFGNAAGSFLVGVPFALGVIGVLVVARRGADALFLLGLLLARMLNGPLKDWASSPRPPSTLLRVTESARGFGFPSGHAMGVVLLMGGLAYVAAASLPRGWPRAIPWGIAGCVVLATGYGRIDTGAHWPTDVLGGYLWGSLILLIAIVVRRLFVTPQPAALHRPLVSE